MAKLTPAQEALLAKAKIAAEKYRQEKLAKDAAKLEASDLSVSPVVAALVSAPTQIAQPVKSIFTAHGSFHPTVVGMEYNDCQIAAIELAMRGKSFCMIGAAGTGKTTTTKEVIGQLVKLPHIGLFDSSTKYLVKGAPAIIIVSFTNKAVNNIKKQLPKELQDHCMTLHKVLEFEPLRDLNGKITGFGPTMTRMSPLPHISCVIFEESSMIGTDLYSMYRNALPEGCQPQEIFLGDLNQLPPVFGPSVLGFKLVELQTVELLHVYRQALQSPIIALAHRIREGKSFNWKANEKGNYVEDAGEHGRVEVRPWKRRMNDLAGVKTMGAVMLQYMDAGLYDPAQDIILCPFNVKFGTLELNKIIAQRLTQDRGGVTYEVIARGTASYWAVGDKVLYDQMEAYIDEIRPAVGYCGKLSREESAHLRRDGSYDDGQAHAVQQKSDMDLMDELESGTLGGEREKNSASHTIKLRFVDSGQTREISASGDINKLLLGYAITVHKSQGSEWKRVFIALHYTHNVAITRELMYTGITRARHDLIIFMDPGKDGSMDSLTKAARTPEIKGVTLAEKAEYFKGKAKEYQQMFVNN
jgi:hypothetical protein